MHRITRWAAAAAAALVLAVGFAPASDAQQDTPPPDTLVCEIPTVEFLYERPTELTETKWKRETFRTENRWEKHVDGVIERKHFIVGGWNEVDTFTDLDWPGAGPLDWGTTPNPISGPHGSTFDEHYDHPYSYRHRTTSFTYVVIDTRQVSTGFEYQWSIDSPGDGWTATDHTRQIPGPNESSGWVTEPPEGDGWELVDERAGTPETIPCPTATATPGTCTTLGEITIGASDHYTAETTGPDDARLVTFNATGDATPATIEVGPFDTSLIDPNDPACRPDPPAPKFRETVDVDVNCDTVKVTTTTTVYRTDPVWDDETSTWVDGDEVVESSSQSVEPASAEQCPECPPEDPDHQYNDPTDGECAEEPPPTTTTAPPATTTTTAPPVVPVADGPKMDSLPNTGNDEDTLNGLKAASALLIGTGAGLVFWASRRPKVIG
jgi:hypothetical protein